MLESLAHRVVLAWGWRRAGLAIGAGALAAGAMAPLNAFPVLWIALPVLVWLVDGSVEVRASGALARVWPAFRTGWQFGFGYFLAGLWWIGAAMTVDLAQFGWMIPIAVPGLAAGLAIFFGLGVVIARIGWTESPWRIVALAIGLSLSEFLRGVVLTGFPWNALGYALAANVPMMQIGAVVGLPGMTFLAALLFAAPAALADRGGRRFFVGCAVLFGLVVGFGFLRLAMVAGTPAAGDVAGVKLRIMQPSVDQWKKWRPDYREEIVARYLALSSGKAVDDKAGVAVPAGTGLDGITHLIWPESAFPFLLMNEPAALASIAQLIGDKTTLITGAIRAAPPGPGETTTRYYNSVFAIGANASILGAYDKVHLVPFGEYLPFQDTLESYGIRQLTHLRGGFSAGSAVQTLRVPGTPPFSALVCYEAIFPGAIVDEANRPEWLVNVTNDGWFGLTPGPWQHLQQARLRAVEEGLPLVRAANTGISAVVDAFGHIRATLSLGEAGVLDAALPAAAPRTPYSRYGNWVFLTMIIVATTLVSFRAIKLFR